MFYFNQQLPGLLFQKAAEALSKCVTIEQIWL